MGCCARTAICSCTLAAEGSTSDHRTSLRSFARTWPFGSALLAIVIGAGLHVSDSREFIVLAEHASGWWIALALFLQTSLVRTLGIVPGGIGTFEAASVLRLTLTGATVAQAPSATLLFRKLSFWIPLLPGLWAPRRILAAGEPTVVERRDYWSLTAPQLLEAVSTDEQGLSATEAARRLRQHGPNTLRAQQSLSRLRLLGNQLRSSLLFLLVFAAVASAATREWIDSGIVLSVVFATVAIGYSREHGAHQAFTGLFGFVRIPMALLLTICAISALYVVATELVKRPFFRSAD